MLKYGNRAKQAFTLMEMLLVLLIMGLIFQSGLSLLASYRQADDLIEADRQGEGYLFLTLIQEELEAYRIRHVDPQGLYLQKIETEELYSVSLKNHVIYKEPGYQPYLYGVNAWALEWVDGLLYIEIEFDNGEYFNGYVFERN